MNIMIDFETLDTKNTSLVLSLGMCIFNKEKIIFEKLWHFDIQSQIDSGRTINGSTIMFWIRQANNSKMVFDIDNGPVERTKLPIFCDEFSDIIKRVNEKLKLDFDSYNLWANSPMFDVSILEHIFKTNNKTYKFNFWNYLDFRTLDKLSDIKTFCKREGDYHSALDDAKYQANCVIEYFKKIKIGLIIPKEKKK